MSDLRITKEKVLEAASKCNTAKETLKVLFPECFPINIKESVRTFEDACKATATPITLDKFSKGDSDTIAYEKLKIIAKALNQGWKPDYSNSSQRKYYPWFEWNGAGFEFASTNYGCTHTITAVSPRLVVFSDEMAVYFGKQFADVWREYLNPTSI